MQDLIVLIEAMTEKAGEIARRHYRTGIDIDHKGDLSPVTIADRDIEQTLRELVESERPEDGFLGEEFGTKESKNGLMWVVDPIDGTKSFIAGRPSFGTLIALWEGDVPLMGAIYQPITGELWLGVKDRPSSLNGSPVKTRSTISQRKLRIGSTSPSQFEEKPEILAALRTHKDFFVWGGDCYLYGMLACGGLDLVIEYGLGTYDYAAIPPVIEGAGGVCSDWTGAPLTLNSEGHIIACANRDVQKTILDILNV